MPRLYKILIVGPQHLEIPNRRLFDLIEFGPNADELDAIADLRVGEALDYHIFLDEYRVTRTS
jgi:hypothetical protein